jgi:hypothetical protein
MARRVRVGASVSGPIPAGMPSRPFLSSSRKSAPCLRRRRAAAWIATVPLLPLAAPVARADTIQAVAASLRVEDERVELYAEFSVSFTSTLEEALQRGIPLYFVQEFELARPRWYWFDEKVIQSATTYRVSYVPLTRQYRVSSGLLGQTFDELKDVERLIGRISARAVARADQLEAGARYDAAVRVRLDVDQLPKPFQVSALASREWQLASDWFRWSWSFAP